MAFLNGVQQKVIIQPYRQYHKPQNQNKIPFQTKSEGEISGSESHVLCISHSSSMTIVVLHGYLRRECT